MHAEVVELQQQLCQEQLYELPNRPKLSESARMMLRTMALRTGGSRAMIAPLHCSAPLPAVCRVATLRPCLAMTLHRSFSVAPSAPKASEVGSVAPPKVEDTALEVCPTSCMCPCPPAVCVLRLASLYIRGWPEAVSP